MVKEIVNGVVSVDKSLGKTSQFIRILNVNIVKWLKYIDKYDVFCILTLCPKRCIMYKLI